MAERMIAESSAIELARAYASVANYRMGDKLSRIQHGDLIHDCVLLRKVQEKVGIEMLSPAKMDRIIKAFEPEGE